MLHASAGQTQDQDNPTAALKPHMKSCGAPTPGDPMACSESISSPVVSVPGSITDTVGIAQDSAHSKQLSPVKAATESAAAAKDINLLTDPSDCLLLASAGVQDDHAMCDDLFLGSHHDLPDDPLEGLCIPSWQDLLNEAVSEFNPQESPRAGTPNDAGGMPHAYRAAHESPQGWDFPALPEEGPVQKRVKTGISSATQGSSTLLSWDHPQDQCQTLPTEPERNPAYNMAGSCTVGKSDFDMQPADAQARMHTSSGQHEARSDKLDQEAQQMMMMEISSAVNGAQHAQHQPRPAAVQKRRVGCAKRAKRAMAGCKGQGKRAAANQAQGKVNVSMSGQGQGQRPHGASLGKLLPFDSLKVRISIPT